MANSETKARFETYLHSAGLIDKSSAVDTTESALILGDLKTAQTFTRALYDSTMSHNALEYLQEEVHRLARPNFGQPFMSRYTQLAEARKAVCDYIDANRFPFQQQTLLALAARIVGLQAHLLLDQGMYNEAAHLIQTAWLFAQGSDSSDVQAWTLGVRSLISFWSGDYRRALKTATDGSKFTSATVTKLRLTALTARSAAKSGDLTAAEEAIHRTIQHGNDIAGDADIEGTLFDFPAYKLASYQTTSLLEFQSDEHACQARTIAHDALQQTTFIRASPDELALRLDIATASLTIRDATGFSDQLAAIDSAPEAAYTASIRQRIRRLAAQAQAAPIYGDRDSRDTINHLVSRTER
ncbi:hypothetical protein [Haloglycomyces albus]|uniref:hypothetical protein n=1 Tax=Haloglycomyces albus TaxID=526067 RepID=UPI0012EBD138|nr:hypothetical protein [Haloglycomyces albus]